MIIKSKRSYLIFLEHYIQNSKISLPMPLNSFLSIFLQTFLLSMDFYQRWESSKNILEFELFLSKFWVGIVEIYLEVLELHLMTNLKLFYYWIIMENSPCQLILILLLSNIWMGKLLTEFFSLRSWLFFYNWQKWS